MAISFIRTVILFCLIVVALRIMGKRQLGELEPSELVVAVLISDLASHPLQDTGTPLLYGVIPVLTLLSCEILISGFVVKSLKFRSLISGKPNILIDNGQIIQREMRKNRFTIDELCVELRKQGILDISTIQYAVLETDGSLSVILYPDESPLTPKAAGLTTDSPAYPVILINEGHVLDDNLKVVGVDTSWLRDQLRKYSIKSPKDVYLMTADKNKKVYFAPKEKKK